MKVTSVAKQNEMQEGIFYCTYTFHETRALQFVRPFSRKELQVKRWEIR